MSSQIKIQGRTGKADLSSTVGLPKHKHWTLSFLTSQGWGGDEEFLLRVIQSYRFLVATDRDKAQLPGTFELRQN